jgi:hypothetical protein
VDLPTTDAVIPEPIIVTGTKPPPIDVCTGVCSQFIYDRLTMVDMPDVSQAMNELRERVKEIEQQENDEDYCTAYETFAMAQTVVGVVGDGAGALEDILSRTPAAVIPQAQGFMKGLKVIEGIGLGGNAAIGLYTGYRYDDWNAFYEGVGSALAGGAVAAGYKKIANIAQPNRNKDLIADIIANVVPAGVNLENSGPCTNDK